MTSIQRSPRCVPPRLPMTKQQVQYDPGQGERELTAPPEDGDPVPAYSYLPCVELRFSDIPRTKHGLVFGRDPKSDVVLPDRHISFHHFTLTFDTAKRLIVKDWGSLSGVEVTYDNEGRGRRRDFQWIVGGDVTLTHKEAIIINLRDTIKFQVVPNDHDIAEQPYIDKVNLFCKGRLTAPELFGDLDIPLTADTELPTGTQTPSTGEIHLQRRLGSGAFGVVTHRWNVTDGVAYALKEPSRYDFDKEDWEKEARIMEQVSHVSTLDPFFPIPRLTFWQDHIVRLLSSSFTPRPRLHLEYAPMGSLAQQDHLSTGECVSVLYQCLSALNYLHNEKDPPIAHRDIKPDNILVFQRAPGHIHVKLGDFGLSKDSEYYKTFCGSFLYTAPEINKNSPHVASEKTAYTTGVDIWSLGVAMYELLCKLPPYKKSYRERETAWAEVILAKFRSDFRKQPDELRRFLLDAMLVVDWRSRWSTQQCLERVLLMPGTAENLESPRTSAHSNGSGKTTVRYSYPQAGGAPSCQQPLPRSPMPSDLPTSAGGFPGSGTSHAGSRAILKRGASSLVSPPKRIERSGGDDYGGDEEEAAVDSIVQLIEQGRPR